MMKSIDSTELGLMFSAEKWQSHDLRTSARKNDLSASVMRIFALLKRIAAISNYKLGMLSQDVASHIIMATKELAHDRDTHRQFTDFSLTNWAAAQDVLNTRLTKHATKIANARGGREIVVADADVNLNQSSQNWFFSAIQIFLTLELRGAIQPTIERLCSAARLQARGDDEDEAASSGTTGSRLDLGEWARQLAYAASNLEVAIADFATLDLHGENAANGKGSDAKGDFNASCVSRLIGSTGSDFSMSPKSLSPAKRNDLFFKLSIALCMYSNTLMQMTDRLRWLVNEEFARNMGVSNPASLERKIMELKHAENCRDFDAVTSCCIQIIANDAAIAAVGKRGNLEEAFSLFTMASYLLKSIGKLVQAHFRLEKYLLPNDAAAASYGGPLQACRPNLPRNGAGDLADRTERAQRFKFGESMASEKSLSSPVGQ